MANNQLKVSAELWKGREELAGVNITSKAKKKRNRRELYRWQMFTPYKNLLGKTCSKEEGSSQTSCCSKCPKGNIAASPTGDRGTVMLDWARRQQNSFFQTILIGMRLASTRQPFLCVFFVLLEGSGVLEKNFIKEVHVISTVGLKVWRISEEQWAGEWRSFLA